MSNNRSNIANKRDLIGDDKRLSSERSRLLMEEENENRLLELRNKMSSLKSIAIDMDSEVKTQNKYLDGMGDDMSNAANGVTITLNKVGKMISNADQPSVLIIALVILFIFVILWRLFRK